jgi:hypothetical protein
VTMRLPCSIEACCTQKWMLESNEREPIWESEALPSCRSLSADMS